MATPLLSPRKIPIQSRARATWDALLEAAAQLLEAGGLEAFNTNAVAARAGASVGTLYQYFPNKDALMAALIAREQQARAASLAHFANGLPQDDVRALVQAVVAAAVAGETARPRLSACLDHEEQRLMAAGIVEDAGRHLDAALARMLAPMLPRLDDDALLTAMRTMRVTARAIIDDALNRAVPDPERARTECVRMLVGYLVRLAAGD